MRVTYRIDVPNKSVVFWNSEQGTWTDQLAGVRTLEATPARIYHSLVDAGEDQIGGRMPTHHYVDFNRTLGKVRDTRTVIDGERRRMYEFRFIGECATVNEPSSERAF